MPYLFPNDFKKSIQTDNLSQVINSDQTILTSGMLDAEEEAKEYLRPKYMLEQEFAETLAYDVTKTYNPGDRVYLDAPAYSATEMYALQSLILFTDGNVYNCTSAITTPEAFNPAHWLKLGLQNALFFVPIPFPCFNINTMYVVGTQVWWKGKIYTCAIATFQIDHTDLIQFVYYSAIPQANILPDDPTNGIKYWGVGVTAPVPPNSLPGGFASGDNRNRNLVRHCVSICLFIIHQRIAPRNIPELRTTLYMGASDDRTDAKDGVIYPEYSALGWLQAAQGSGRRQMNLPYIQPMQGARLRWGSNIRNINGY